MIVRQPFEPGSADMLMSAVVGLVLQLPDILGCANVQTNTRTRGTMRAAPVPSGVREIRAMTSGEPLMQASRLLISTLTAVGIVGLAGVAVAQTTTTTGPGTTTTTAPRVTTTVTPPTVTSTTETAAERMERERVARDRMNAPAGSGGMTSRSADSTIGSTARRDANGNLIARADRN